jgi:hypothetical protein
VVSARELRMEAAIAAQDAEIMATLEELEDAEREAFYDATCVTMRLKQSNHEGDSDDAR